MSCVHVWVLQPCLDCGRPLDLFRNRNSPQWSVCSKCERAEGHNERGKQAAAGWNAVKKAPA